MIINKDSSWIAITIVEGGDGNWNKAQQSAPDHEFCGKKISLIK